MKKVKTNLGLVIIIFISLLMVLVLSIQKKGMHEDEYYTYLLANNEKGSGLCFALEDGVRVDPASTFDEYFYADDFDIRSIWNNQANDIHPPLYYLLFHVFELLAHNIFGGGLKSGIILNAVFHICNVFLVYIIIDHLLHDDVISLLGCGLYALMPIVLGNVIFIRMYVLLSTFVLMLTICILKGIEQGMNLRFCICLCMISIGGALTHYYFLIYLFYSCLVYFVWEIYLKKWKEIKWFLITMCSAGGISIAIFPDMLRHIFESNKGHKSVDYLFHSSWLEQVHFFYEPINSLFGGMLLGVLVIASMWALYGIYSKKAAIAENIMLRKWTILLLPCILYFITVSKITVIKSSRYVSPIYGICIILLAGGIKKLIDVVTKRSNRCIAITAVICIIGFMLGNSWRLYEWKELYLEAEECEKIAEAYGKNNECINIYDKVWKSTSAVDEFKKYQLISFISVSNLDILRSETYKEYDHVIMHFESGIGDDIIHDILEIMLVQNPDLERYEQLYQYKYHVVYYLE